MRYREGVLASGWHNGSKPEEPGGYGLKILARDRDKYFDREWDEVVVSLEGGENVAISLSKSFWRTSTELRSAEVGQWLLDQAAAPWHKGNAPSVVVTPTEDNRFSARVLKRRTLG